MIRNTASKKSSMPLEDILHRLLVVSKIADALTPDPDDSGKTEGYFNMRDDLNAILSSYGLQDMEAAIIDPELATPQTLTNSPITADELAESGIKEGDVQETIFRVSDLCEYTQSANLDQIYGTPKTSIGVKPLIHAQEHDLPPYQDRDVTLDGINAWMNTWPIEIDIEHITSAIGYAHANSIDTLTKDTDHYDTFEIVKHTIDTSAAYAAKLFEDAHEGHIPRGTHKKLAQTIYNLWKTAETISRIDRTQFGSAARIEFDRLTYNLRQSLDVLLPGRPAPDPFPTPTTVLH